MTVQQLLVTAGVVVLLSAGSAAAQSATSPGDPGLRSPLTAGGRFAIESIRDRCITLTNVKEGPGESDFRECRVSEFGEFGTVDGETYVYAIYCLIPGYATDKGNCGDSSFVARNNRARALAVFVRPPSGKTVRLLVERDSSEIGLYSYDKPEIVRSGFGTLLYLPIVVDGTGHGNQSEYYLRVGGQWDAIDGESWLSDLKKQIPSGLEMRMGVWPDLHTMRAETGLYRAGDANCCPTGGVVRARLAIRSRQLVIESIEIDRGRDR